METMTQYLKKRANKHKVIHEFSGRAHFYKVRSDSGEDHSVSIQVGCDCQYMGTQGVAQGRICSHILAVLKEIYNKGDIQISVGSENMIQLRRNACMSMVRPQNRVLNEVRTSMGESTAHIEKKIEVCRRLKEENKHFICEAIFTNGSGRADILVLDTFTAIEIVYSESEESIEEKRKKYPQGIRIEVEKC